VKTSDWSEVWSKVVGLVRSFPKVCCMPFERKEIRARNSRLLVVGSQTTNLTPNLSFGPNLCLKCPNESCEPVLDIYVPRDFQWYKKLFNSMGFDPCNHFLKVQESIKTPTPKVGTQLGVWGFIPSHCPTLPWAWDVTSGLPPWPAPLQALALVASPRLGLW